MVNATAHLGSGLAKIDRIYESAKSDSIFRQALLTADGDKFSFLPCIIERTAIAGTYYGYLVAKHGDDWHLHIR